MEISMDTSQFKLPEANQAFKQSQKSENESEFGALHDVGKISEKGSGLGFQDVGQKSEEGSEFGALYDVGQKGGLVNVFA